MIAEFDRMAAELEMQISAEEKKSGITDVGHFAYPTFAKAARQRRDNLRNSQLDLQEQKKAADAALAEAEQELSKAEMLENRDARGHVAEGGPARGAEKEAGARKAPAATLTARLFPAFGQKEGRPAQRRPPRAEAVTT